MKEIAKTEFYEIRYDETTNWVYWTMKGFWESMDVVPNFYSDWEAGINSAEKPFKIYSDLSTLKTMPDDVKDANDKMQQKLMQNGCVKVSCLLDSSVTKMSLNDVIKSSGMEKMVQYFTKDEAGDAKKWLSEEQKILKEQEVSAK